MKIRLFFFLILGVIFFPFLEAKSDDVSSLNTGKDANGNFIIPSSLAKYCDLSIEDISSSSKKLKECMETIVKNKSTIHGSETGKALGVLENREEENNRNAI